MLARLSMQIAVDGDRLKASFHCRVCGGEEVFQSRADQRCAEKMDLGLQGKTALVLGGRKGLGRGVADALAAEGVAVALLARGKEALEQAAAEINGRGGRAIAVAADLADWPAVERAANTARQQLGPIDILLNNSGGPPPTRAIGVAPELWEAQFRSMVLVFFRLTDLLLPEM